MKEITNLGKKCSGKGANVKVRVDHWGHFFLAPELLQEP